MSEGKVRASAEEPAKGKDRQEIDCGRHELAAFANTLNFDVVLDSIFKIDVQGFARERAEGNVRVAFHQGEEHGRLATIRKRKVHRTVGKLPARCGDYVIFERFVVGEGVIDTAALRAGKPFGVVVR